MALHGVKFRRAAADGPGVRSEPESGYTLIELLVVLLILGVVLTGLTTAFISGTESEVNLSRRTEAQADARIGLNRMRLDIHCSSSNLLPPQPNAFGGYTLTLPQTKIQCPAVSTDPAGVQWCTIPVNGSTTRYQLFRETSGSCDGVDATVVIDYIAPPPTGWPTNSLLSPAPLAWDGNIWPTPQACPSGGLPTIGVDMNVSLDPLGHPSEGYELRDEVAIRNADHCP